MVREVVPKVSNVFTESGRMRIVHKFTKLFSHFPPEAGTVFIHFYIHMVNIVHGTRRY